MKSFEMASENTTDRTPELPQQVSSDGRELWDWAGKFSAHVHRQDKMRELCQQIKEVGTRCGDCSRWMTKACPKEIHSNATGRSTGPHMNVLKCVEFIETSTATMRRAALTEELRKVEHDHTN